MALSGVGYVYENCRGCGGEAISIRPWVEIDLYRQNSIDIQRQQIITHDSKTKSNSRMDQKQLLKEFAFA